MDNEFITFTIGKKKHIALIAHDNEKPKLIEWCKENYDILKNHSLYGTGTTARLIADKAGLRIKGYNSGPLGGDQQIGAKIVEGVIDFVVFFSDPLTAQPHDPIDPEVDFDPDAFSKNDTTRFCIRSCCFVRSSLFLSFSRSASAFSMRFFAVRLS